MIKNDNQSMMYLLRYCDVEEEKEKLYICLPFYSESSLISGCGFPDPGA